MSDAKTADSSAPYTEQDYHRTVVGEIHSRLLPGTSVEIIHDTTPGSKFRHVLFDFDGTLSLIREGWPEVMVPMMVEVLQATGSGATTEALPNRACWLC